jgi:chitinase
MNIASKCIMGATCAVALLASALLSAEQPMALGNKRLVAYYLYQDQNKKPAYTAANIPYKKLTHLIHVALVVDPAGDGSIHISPNAIEASLIPKAHAAKVRVLVCVQGPSQAFSKIAAAQTTRELLAKNLKDFVVKYKYDGVDIDWEVPDGNLDVANNVLLMQAIRDALPEPQYLLSMATPSVPGHWGEFDFAHLTPIVDFYNVMTYDFHGPWTPHAGHNSPLFMNESDPGRDGSLDDSINLYLNKLAVPPEKINLGTAFYGYEFPVDQLNAPCDSNKKTIAREYGYYIKQRINQDGWVKATDTIAMAPYLTRAGAAPGFITYDDVASTARKVAYALEVRNLGGVFMWELSGDYDGKKQDLLNSMVKAVKQAEKQTY